MWTCCNKSKENKFYKINQKTLYKSHLMSYNNFIPPKTCEDGGIGRRARLRGEWLTAVRVRVSFLAPLKKQALMPVFFTWCSELSSQKTRNWENQSSSCLLTALLVSCVHRTPLAYSSSYQRQSKSFG